MTKGTNIKLGNNDPCHCGSGKKYKKCCRKKDRKNSNSIQNIDFSKINETNKLIKDNPSAKEMKESLDGMKALRSATESGLLDGLIPAGLDVDELTNTFPEIDKLEKQFSIFEIPDKFNKHFLKYGWIAHESIKFEAMKKAVELAEEEKFEEAEQVLIDGYNEQLEINIRIIKGVSEFELRIDLIQKAYEDYLNERYHSCIPIVFSIIDGVVADMNEIGGNKGFFTDGDNIYAWDSIAAHQTGLNKLKKLLYQSRGTTTTEELDIPYRNGIIHGRDLGYANQKVAVKTWATLIALKDGIVAIKTKGMVPIVKEKPTIGDMMTSIVDHEKKMELITNWKPRKLKVNENFPEFGTSIEYQDGSPERTLVEFFESWKSNKYGLMVEKLNYRFFEEDTLGKMVFELKNGIFKDKQIKNFSILSIDDSAMTSTITVNLTIQKEDDEISKDIIFHMNYENENGEMEPIGMKSGSWKIYNGIYDIEGL
ncbi:MAG: SEC-C metal-binding domain-containing protein [Methanobacteriaceae archaeon]|nr:SEC-C metal-binding domain-containing protein [Methanobacteriaceae archaeon]MDO9626858.1 SEC-C metal-binding domain-containing protein [Methanobacteriaceae archaeon]